MCDKTAVGVLHNTAPAEPVPKAFFILQVKEAGPQPSLRSHETYNARRNCAVCGAHINGIVKVPYLKNRYCSGSVSRVYADFTDVAEVPWTRFSGGLTRSFQIRNAGFGQSGYTERVVPNYRQLLLQNSAAPDIKGVSQTPIPLNYY